MDKSISKKASADSLAAYKAEQAKFKATPVPVRKSQPERVAVTSKIAEGGYSGETYYARRGQYFGGYHPPRYSYSGPSQFGIWDGVALWFMLDHLSDSQQRDFFYHHRDDEGVKAWREVADRQALQDEGLRAKLAAIDKNTSESLAKGVKTDPSFLPVDRATSSAIPVVAPSVAEADLPRASDGVDIKWGWIVGGLLFGIAAMFVVGYAMNESGML